MNKKKIVLASTLAILLAPVALNTLPTTQTVHADTQLIGTIRRGGTIPVDSNDNFVESDILGNFSSWKLGQRITIGGNPYYEVATNEYVDATSMDITQNGKLLNPVSSEISYINHVETVSNAKGASIIDDNNNSLGITLPKGSSWKVDRVRIFNGYPYYRVATNEWVKALDFNMADSIINDSHTVVIPNTHQPITLRTTTTLYNSNGVSLGITLPKGSSWKVAQEKTINGHQYYQVATDEWVLATEDQSTSIFQNGTVTATLSKPVQLYDTSTNSMTRTLPAGSAWKINSAVENSAGYFFAKVSNNEWIPLGSSIFTDNILQEELANSSTYEPYFAINLFK
ncbi:SLAP domain-containing protein [Companilactobacillus alimentarius]|uniref:SLAP domain-containing protein n=1 Tax=Companilactobacillus alimentarius TaxID=1602 RepID=UPI003D7DD343